MVTRHRQQIDELKDTYVAFDKYFLQKEQTARCEYGSVRDEMKNKACISGNFFIILPY